MSYLDYRFPVLVATGPVGGPGFSTDLVTLTSGDEQRNQNWSESQHTYEMSSGIKSDANFAEIGAHFRMARGRLHHFRVKDWADFKIARSDGLLTRITSTTYQVFKVYGTVFGFEENRKITRVVSGTDKMWKDGAPLTAAVDYTLDVETGIVTFPSDPTSAVLEITCEFDVPCRYDTDKLQATLVSYSNSGSWHSWTSVPLVEQRE